jgi:hypothetical protein
MAGDTFDARHPAPAGHFPPLLACPVGRSRRATSFLIYEKGGTAHDWADNVEMALPLVPLTVAGGKGSLLRPVEPEVEAEGRECRLVEIGLGRDAEAREVGEGGFSPRGKGKGKGMAVEIGELNESAKKPLVPSRP